MPEAGSGVEEYKVISQAQYFLFLSWTFESSVNFLKSQNFSDWPYLERKNVSKFNMIWRKVASAMLGPFPFPQTATRTVPGNQAGIASLRRPSWSRLLLATGHQPGLPHTIFTKSLLFQFLFSLLFSILEILFTNIYYYYYPILKLHYSPYLCLFFRMVTCRIIPGYLEVKKYRKTPYEFKQQPGASLKLWWHCVR